MQRNQFKLSQLSFYSNRKIFNEFFTNLIIKRRVYKRENSSMMRRCTNIHTHKHFREFFSSWWEENSEELSHLKKTHEKWKLKNYFFFSWEEFSASFSGWCSSKVKATVWVEPWSDENIRQNFSRRDGYKIRTKNVINYPARLVIVENRLPVNFF